VKLIVDTELELLIAQGQLVRNVKNASSQVKGCSVDLTVGGIFLPGAKMDAVGCVQIPLTELALEQGQTAVIVTQEIFALSPRHAGIAFPPSTVSLKGLLMTNPGHIDPGYSGPLHVTVINMGKKVFSLRAGDRIMRALLFELDTKASKAPAQGTSGPVNAELLERLSHDFLDVSARTQEAARVELKRAQVRQQYLQLGVPIVAVILTALLSYFLTLQKVEERMSKVEALVPVVSRLDRLDLERLREFDERLKALEPRDKRKK
jgi:dCTP deaminase